MEAATVVGWWFCRSMRRYNIGRVTVYSRVVPTSTLVGSYVRYAACWPLLILLIEQLPCTIGVHSQTAFEKSMPVCCLHGSVEVLRQSGKEIDVPADQGDNRHLPLQLYCTV